MMRHFDFSCNHFIDLSACSTETSQTDDAFVELLKTAHMLCHNQCDKQISCSDVSIFLAIAKLICLHFQLKQVKRATPL